MIISVMTLLTVWRVPEIAKFRWATINEHDRNEEALPAKSPVSSKLAGVDS
jgi:hypothetical protein